MFNLQESEIKKWHSKLPKDIKENLGSEISSDPDGLDAFCLKLKESSQSEWRSILKANLSLLEDIGRLRRVRLLSYISSQVYPYNVKVFHQIVNDDEDSGDGKSSIKQLFIEDIKALNEAIAERVAKNSFDTVALDAIRSTSYEIQPGMGI